MAKSIDFHSINKGSSPFAGNYVFFFLFLLRNVKAISLIGKASLLHGEE